MLITCLKKLFRCVVLRQFSPNESDFVVFKEEELNYKSVAKEISKPPACFLAPEVQWASKFTVFV